MKILYLRLMTLGHVYIRFANKHLYQIFNIEYFPVHMNLKFILVNFSCIQNCLICKCLLFFHFNSVQSLSRIRLFATPWTIAYQAPQSMEFSRQEYWSGLPFPSPGDLPNTGIEPRSPALQADALLSELPGKP